MPLGMFLKIGDVRGESEVAAHEGEIDVLGWSWGMSHSGTMHAGYHGGAGRLAIEDVHIRKRVDTSTPRLMLACSRGEQFKECTLTVARPMLRQLDAVELKAYVVITMRDVLVTAVSTSADQGDDRLIENITLNFADVRVDYHPSEGAGETASYTWNIPANQPHAP